MFRHIDHRLSQLQKQHLLLEQWQTMEQEQQQLQMFHVHIWNQNQHHYQNHHLEPLTITARCGSVNTSYLYLQHPERSCQSQ